MRLKPIDERLLVKLEEVQEQTYGSIILPSTQDKQINIGVVIALGQDVIDSRIEKTPMSKLFKEGTKIVFNRYSGTEVSFNSEKYLLVLRQDVMGVLED